LLLKFWKRDISQMRRFRNAIGPHERNRFVTSEMRIVNATDVVA
jgi:hypothetical protein